MEATTTVEVILPDPSQNFYIDKIFSYGDIVIGMLLMLLIAIEIWKVYNK